MLLLSLFSIIQKDHTRPRAETLNPEVSREALASSCTAAGFDGGVLQSAPRPWVRFRGLFARCSVSQVLSFDSERGNFKLFGLI